MKLIPILLAVVLPFSLMTACGGKSSSTDDDKKSDEPTTPASTSDGKADTCAEFCENLAACDGLDTTTCAEDCTDGESTSRAGQEVITECLDADSCDATEAAQLGLLLCIADGAGDIEPSAEGTTYCDTTVDAINGCTGSEPAAELALLGSCEDAVGLASDELLSALNTCAADDCEGMELCVTLALVGNIDLDNLATIQSGETPSPAAVADFLAILAVFGQLGLGGTLGDGAGLGEGAGMGGAAGF